ncbi:MAG: phospholipase D-like domain-containing protein [Pararobbsia sp.]
MIDRKIAVVGSMNLDRRSIGLNTELTVVVHSPEIAQQVDTLFDLSIAPELSFQVRLAPDDASSVAPAPGTPSSSLIWVTQDNGVRHTYDADPEAGLWAPLHIGDILPAARAEPALNARRRACAARTVDAGPKSVNPAQGRYHSMRPRGRPETGQAAGDGGACPARIRQSTGPDRIQPLFRSTRCLKPTVSNATRSARLQCRPRAFGARKHSVRCKTSRFPPRSSRPN